MEVLLYERVNDLRHNFFHLLNCLITTASELRELPKVPGSKVWTIGRVRNCLDAHLGKIVSDKDGVVDWSIVLQEISLARFEECSSFSDGISSLTPLKPQHRNPNPNPLATQLWGIDCLLLPHLSSSVTDSLPSLNLLCHSKTDARFMQAV